MGFNLQLVCAIIVKDLYECAYGIHNTTINLGAEEVCMEMLFMVLGGLGLFLYGIKLMSSGLQTIAGDRMRIILEKGTKTPIRGVLTGIIVTGLIQSSSGTTV